MSITPLEQLKIYASVILDEAGCHGALRTAVYDLHGFFVGLGALGALSQQPSERTYTDHGFAIDPIGAGMCVFEYLRTATYIRGLKAAIEDHLKNGYSGPVNILYAGCGPYALQALITAPFFRPSQVQFSLLEIHDVAMGSAKRLITALGLQDYFADDFLTDAIQFIWPSYKPMHILLTETMTAALKNEAQVAITLNLAPQLAPGGTLLPQSVGVDLVLTNKAGRQEEMMDRKPGQASGRPACDLGTLITLDKGTALCCTNTRYPFSSVDAQVPDDIALDEYDLELRTNITVYKKYRLTGNDCSLTLPRPVKNKEELKGKTMHWIYDNGPTPGLVYSTWCGVRVVPVHVIKC